MHAASASSEYQVRNSRSIAIISEIEPVLRTSGTATDSSSRKLPGSDNADGGAGQSDRQFRGGVDRKLAFCRRSARSEPAMMIVSTPSAAQPPAE